MTTTRQTAPVGSWLKVADKKENILISHTNNTHVAVFVSATPPSLDSAYQSCTATSPFSLGGVSGVDVYIRSLGVLPLDVTVTAV